MAVEARLLDLTVSAEGVAAGVNQAKSFLAGLVGDLAKTNAAAVETNVKVRDAGLGLGRAFAGIAKELMPAADGLSRVARQVDAVNQAQARGAAGTKQATDMVARLTGSLNDAERGYVSLLQAAGQTEKVIVSAYKTGKIGADEFKASIQSTRDAVYEQASAVQRLADAEKRRAQERIAQEREIKALAAERTAAEARAAASQSGINQVLGVRQGSALVGAARDEYASAISQLLDEQDRAAAEAAEKSQRLVSDFLGVRHFTPTAADAKQDYASFWADVLDQQSRAAVSAAGQSQKLVNELLGVRHIAPLATDAQAEYSAFWAGVIDQQDEAAAIAAANSQKLVNGLLGVQHLSPLSAEVEADYTAFWGSVIDQQDRAAVAVSGQSQRFVNELLGVRHIAPLSVDAQSEYSAFWSGVIDRQDEAATAAAGTSQKLVNELLGVRILAPLAADVEADYAAFWGGVLDQQDRAAVAAAGQSQKLVNELLGVRYLGTLSREVEQDYSATWERLLDEQDRSLAEATRKTDEANARLAASYNQVMGSIDPVIAQQQRYDSALASLRAGAAAAGRSADELAADEERLAATMSPSALAARNQARALEELKARTDPAAASLRRLDADQKAFKAALDAGQIDEQEYDSYTAAIERHRTIVQRSTETQKGLAGAIGLSKAQMQALAPQINDVVSGLLMGQPPMMIFTQQSGQIVQALQAGGATLPAFTAGTIALGASVLAVVGGLGLAIAAHYSYKESIKAVNDANKLMGDSTGYSRSQLENLASTIDRVSVRSAREMEASFIRVGNVSGEQFASALEITRDFGRAIGQDLPEAAQSLADILHDPVAGAEKLRDGLRALTAAQTEYAQRLAAQGETGKAQQVILDGLKAKYRDFADEGVGYVGQAYDWLTRKASNAWNAIGKIGAPKTLIEQLADAQAVVDRIESKFRSTMGRSPSADELRRIEPEAYGTLDDLRGKKAAEDAVAAARQQTASLERRRAAGLSMSKQMQTEVGEQNELADQYAALTKSVDAYAQQIEALSEGEGRASGQLAQVIAAFAQVKEAADRARNAKETYLSTTERLARQDGIALTYASQYGQMAERNRARDQALLDTAGQKITAGERLAKVNSAVTQVIASQTAAVTGQVASINDNVASLDRLSAAYGTNAAAVKEAELQQKISQATLGMAPDLALKVAKAITDQEMAQRRLNQAQADFDLRNQIEDAARLAEAEAKSGAAVAESTIQNKIRNQVIKEGVAFDSERARAIEAGTRALEAQNAVARVNSSIRQQNQDLQIARAEYDLLGASNAEREKQAAILKATLQVQNSGDWAQVPQEARDAWISQAGAVAEYKARVADATETSRDFANVISSGFENAILNGEKLGTVLSSLGKDIEKVFLRGFVTKPLENWVQGTMTKLLAPAPANDDFVQPVNDNDPGGYRKLFEQMTGDKGASALGTQSNPMFVQFAGNAALDIRALANGENVPVAIKEAGSLDSLVQQAASKYGIDANLIKGIIQQESSWKSGAVNPRSGAAGLMQIMPANFRAYGVTNPSDPAQNIEAGTKIFREHLDRAGGDISKALSTYSGHIKTSGDAYVSAVLGNRDAYARASTAVAGVSKAQEDQLQALMDSLPIQQQANDNVQTLTSSQQSLVDSVLGITAANENASTVITVQSRAISNIGANAISAADGLTQAGDGAQKFGTAAADGADTFVGGLQKLLGGASDWISGLFGGGSGSGAQQQKVIKNSDGSTSFAPSAKGAGGSWLDAKVFGSGEQSRPSTDFVGPMPQQSGLGGWNPTWGQVIQGIGGIASGAAMATQKGATVGQKIGGGLTAAGGIAAMIPGGQVIGGVMMAAGALLSAVSGAKDRGEKYSISHITLQGNGKYALGDYAQDNDGDPTRFNADASKVAKGLNDIVARLNLTPTGKDSYIDSKNKSAEQAALELLKGMRSGVPEISYAIAHEAAVSLEDMLSHLEFANSFSDQVKTLRSSISDLFSQFQTGVEAGNSLGRTLLDFVDNAQTVFAVTSGAKLPGFARGTLSAPAGWAIVGEEGPEVVRLSGGERIWNARESAQLLAAQGIGADTELVHVRPDELAWMQRTLGGGRINPTTGLPMFLEGDSGGVGDTGGHSGGGHNSNGSGPMGGENAATGSAHSSTADRDAAYGGGWGTSSGGGGIGNTISGWVSAVTGWMAALAGWQADTAENTAAQTEALAAVAGLTPTAVAAALSATAQVAGYGLTGMLEGITGEKGTAAAVSHDYGDQTSAVSGAAGTIGERAMAAGGGRGMWQSTSAAEIDSTLASLATALKADPTGKLTSEMVGLARVGDPGSGGISVQELADDPSKIFRFQVGDTASALKELDTAAQQLLASTGAIPEVLQRALDGANARAAAVGIPTATSARQVQEEQARQQAEALQQRFDAVGLVRDRVAELNGIVASLGNNTFSPVGKDFDALATDMRKAADAYVAAGQAVPDGLFGALKQMEALGAVKKRLLDEVAGVTVESSPEQQKVEQLRGKWSNTATDLVKAFASVGIVGDELAAKLNQGFNNDLKKERGSYSDTLDVAYRKAKGEEGYDSATGLIDSYKTAVKDVNALWPEGADRAAQMAKVTGTLTNNMAGLVKSGSITSTSLQQIITAFADTPDVVRAASAALQQLNDATAEAARSFAAGVSARMYAAVGNNRASGLITLDEQQRKELADATAAGQDTTQLRLVQSAERASQAFTLAQQDVLAGYDQEINARQTFISDLQEGALKVSQIAKQFAAARDALAISQDAPISPQERLNEARRQWDAALATVRSTTASDTDKDTARSNLISLGQTLVSMEKENSAGTARTLYDMVMAVENELGTIAPDSSAATADSQLKTAQDSLKELQRARADAAAVGQRQLGSLADLKSVMDQSYAYWQGTLGPLLASTAANDNRPHYSASAAVQAAWDSLTGDQHVGIARAMGWSGGLDEAFNTWLATDANRASTFESYTQQIASGLRYGANEHVMSAWDALSAGQQADAAREAGYQGGVDGGLNAWAALGHASALESAILAKAHAAGIPGFAMGTLDTPPGAIWVGEKGPELLWQAGGAAVASSADSLRIAGLYRSAANDRFPINVAPIRSPASAMASDNREVVAVLRDIARRIERLEAAIHEAEGEAQFQRSRIARDKLKVMQLQLDELREQPLKRFA